MKCLQCGDCCIRFEIPEINKPSGVRCINLDINNKCLIYEERPETCRKHSYPFSMCPIGQQKQVNNPTGKCLNCGSYVFDNTEFCSNKCKTEFTKSCD